MGINHKRFLAICVYTTYSAFIRVLFFLQKMQKSNSGMDARPAVNGERFALNHVAQGAGQKQHGVGHVFLS